MNFISGNPFQIILQGNLSLYSESHYQDMIMHLCISFEHITERICNFEKSMPSIQNIFSHICIQDRQREIKRQQPEYWLDLRRDDVMKYNWISLKSSSSLCRFFAGYWPLKHLKYTHTLSWFTWSKVVFLVCIRGDPKNLPCR